MIYEDLKEMMGMMRERGGPPTPQALRCKMCITYVRILCDELRLKGMRLEEPKSGDELEVIINDEKITIEVY